MARIIFKVKHFAIHATGQYSRLKARASVSFRNNIDACKMLITGSESFRIHHLAWTPDIYSKVIEIFN